MIQSIMLFMSGGLEGVVFFIVLFVVSLLVLRLVGAWMLRINELITNQKNNSNLTNLKIDNLIELQKQTLAELKKLNSNNTTKN